MKNNRAWRQTLGRVGKWIKDSLSRNLGLKLVSVIFALFLWSYVIASSPAITQEKTLSDVNVTVSGQTVLSSRGLASLTDLGSLDSARVRVRVPQSNYSLVTNDNVRVELDLSGIRQEGKQSVRLRGTSTYGSVVEVYPQYIDLEVERQDQRYVPVNVQLTGQIDPTCWYSVASRNPSQVVVTGPASRVRMVSLAMVSLDVTDRSASHTRMESFSLLDAQGQEVAGTLSTSTSSVEVKVDIYPTRTLPICKDLNEVLSGRVPDGYQVDSVEVSPEQVVVAAEQTLLDALTELALEPVDVTGVNQTFTTITPVQSLKGIKYLSSEDASVTIAISEQVLTKRFSNIQLEMLASPEDKRVVASVKRTDVRVEGPYSIVRSLTRDDIQATVNLAGLTEGQYELPIELSVDNYPNLICVATPGAINVTVGPKAAQQ